MTTDYKHYTEETKVQIISTGEIGIAFESALGAISVFVGNEQKCRYFSINDVKFLD